MSLKRSHKLYLQSKHRESGTPSNYIISLPEIIRSDANEEYFKISLQNFTTYNSWYLVKDDADTITIDGTPISIPHGTYTYQRLSRILEASIDATVQWLQDTNTMAFMFNTSKTISFDNLGTLLGFTPYTNYTGSVITSPFKMTPYEHPHIIIHLNNIAPVEDHLCLSNHTGEVRLANILGKVLINAPPFQLITHQQVLESESLFTADNSLGALEFYITDNDGNEFTDMTDHEMVLTIESVDIEDYDMKDLLKEIKEVRATLKDLLMFKVLGRR